MFQGVSAVGGTIDSGPNNVAFVRELAVSFVKDWMTANKTAKKLLLKIVGHSRGGVAASLIANDVSKEYPVAKHPTFDIQLTQFDPVPGPSTVSSAKDSAE